SSSFTPSPRYATSSILIGTKLYFFGGWAKDSDNIENCQSDIFYLDISNSFNIEDDNQNIPWIDLTSTAEIPERICWHNSLKEINNNTIYLFGGITQNIKSKELTFDTLLYKFDITSQKWSKPSLTGISPGRRIRLEIVQDNKNDIENTYIFGGLTTNKIMWFNDMNILDTLKLNWLLVETSGINIPPPQADFTTTLLSNGIILYIGGREAVNVYGDKITYKKMDQ
ncbi:16260_t:CDS:1, partial [Dentiscutata erythropus]